MRQWSRWLPRWLRDKRPSVTKRLPVVQIEITGRCQMACVFCPHQTLEEQWIRGDLSWDLYRDAIAPNLHHFDLVYLQGWGEPMIHPHLWDMLHLAQQAGCRTGFTTNGLELTPDHSARLLDVGIDILSILIPGQ